MARFLYNLLMMSVSGGMMFALAALLNFRMKSKFSRWYYAMLAAAAALMIFPVQAVFSVPKLIRVTLPQSAVISSGTAVSAAHSAQSGIGVIPVMFTLWAVIAAGFIAYNAYRCFTVRRNLTAVSEETYDDDILEAYLEVSGKLHIRRAIDLRTSAALKSPLLFGVIKPMIIIPDREFTRAELIMILTHELTHYRHKDLLIKLAASFAVALHWFNPLSYMLAGSINTACELCCDESVLDTLNLSDKKEYGRLLISVIENSASGAMAYTTAMASPKDRIQHRLLRIVEFKKPSLLMKTAGVITALSMAVCSVTAFGFDAAKEALPEKITRAVEKAGKTEKTGKTEKAGKTGKTEKAEKEPRETAAPTDVISGGNAAEAENPPTAENSVIPTADVSTEQTDEQQTEPSEDALENLTAVPDEESGAEQESADEYYEPDENSSYAEPAYTEPYSEPAQEYDSARDFIPAAADTPAAPDTQSADLIRVIRFPAESYVFNPVFTAGAPTAASDIFYAEEDTNIHVMRSQSSECLIAIYRVNGGSYEGAELIYNEAEAEKINYNLGIRVKKGESYYLTATAVGGAQSTSILVSAG